MASIDAAKEGKAPPKINSIMRNSIRYTLSEREYKALHRRVLRRLPSSLKKSLPQPSAYASPLKDNDDFNAATVRASARLFVAVQAALKLYSFVLDRISRRAQPRK